MVPFELNLRSLAVRVYVMLCISCAVGAAAKVNCATATPDWTDTTSFSEAPIGSHPQVAAAMDATGDAMVVWCQSTGVNERVLAMFRPAGGSFGTPIELSHPGESARYPVATMNSHGDAAVAWLGHRIVPYENEGFVEAVSRPAGGTFSQPVQLSESVESENPAVTMDPQGNATIVWMHYTADTRQIEAASLFADGTFTPAVVLSKRKPPETGEMTSTAPSLASNSSGQIAIAWSGAKAAGGQAILPYSPQLVRGSVGGTLPLPTVLTTEIDESPVVAIDGQGDVAMTWVRSGSVSATSIGANSETFGAPEMLTNASSRFAGIIDGQPTATADDAGEALVTWLSGTQPRAVVFTIGAPISKPVELANPGANTGAPVMRMNPQGDSMTMWTSKGGNHEGIPVVEGVARPAGGSFGQPLPLATFGTPTSLVQTAVDSQGDAISAWATSDGKHEFIQVAGFQATGPRLETVQAPPEGKVGTNLAFSVTASSVWSTVASTLWSWGDGTPDVTGTSVSHTFGAPGVYKVTVTVTDAMGNLTNITRAVSIYGVNAPPKVEKSKEPLHHPKNPHTITAAFTPLFGTRAAAGGNVLGLLVEIHLVRGIANGDTLTVRCITSCDHSLQQVVRVGRHGHTRGKLVLTKPLTLRRSTRIEVDVQAPNRSKRFDQYRFALVHGQVLAYLTRKGCLSVLGRREAC